MRSGAISRLLFFLLFAGLAGTPGFSETPFWVDEMVAPDPQEAVEEDSAESSLSLLSITSMTPTFKTKNRLEWEHVFQGGVLTQGAEYRYEQASVQSSIQFVDFSGMLLYNDVLTDGFDAGFDWTPISSYTRTPKGILQSSIDVGPVVQHSLFTVPYSVRGGLYGYAWSDTLESLSPRMQDYHGTPGFYVGGTIGNPDVPIGSLPLFLNINATGRALDGNNLSHLTASALFCRELPSWGDSIFVYLGDSLTNGKELYVGEFEGKSLYSNTPWRINHSFSGAAGVKLARRFGIASRLYYRYFVNSIAYPSNSAALDDLLRTGNWFGVAADTREERLLSYNGGIEFGRDHDDWLFRRTFEEDAIATSENRAALVKNLLDHYSNIVRTENTVKVRLPFRLSMVYQLKAMKDSKHFENSYWESTTLKNNQNENDRVQIDNILSLRYERDSLYYIETYGSYGKNYQYYYREQRSAESKVTHEYRIGLDFGATVGRFMFREKVYTDADVEELRYAINLPLYARKVTSSLSAKLALIENRLFIAGKWDEMYDDYGYWLGEAYQDDSLLSGGEYYAIERKGTQYWLDFAVEVLWAEAGNLKVGTAMHEVFQHQWSPKAHDYVFVEDQGYGIEPYCSLEWQAPSFIVNLRMRRLFYTRDPYRFSFRKNWDFTLSLQRFF